MYSYIFYRFTLTHFNNSDLIEMPFTREKRETYERLKKKYCINFIDDLTERDWPESHREVFQSINQLSIVKYDEYAAQTISDAAIPPWKQEAKHQTRKLVERAKDCVGRNEATWRLACEPLVFGRFTAEIAW